VSLSWHTPGTPGILLSPSLPKVEVAPLSAEILTWGFIASFYIAAFAVLQLEKHWHRTAEVFFSLATMLAMGRLVLWVWYNPDGSRGGIAFTVSIFAIVATIWFIQKVETHIREGQAVKGPSNESASYIRDLIERWRRMIVISERKYMGGKEPPSTSFSEIFQRQPAFIQLVPLLSKEAIDALDADVREEPSRTERKRPVALRSLLAKEVSRIETDLKLFPNLVGSWQQTDQKLLFEINKANTTIRVDQSNSAIRIWLDVELRFENKDTYPIAFKYFDVSMYRYGTKNQKPGFDIGIKFAFLRITSGGVPIEIKDFEGTMIQERRLTPFYRIYMMIAVEDDQIQRAEDLDVLDTLRLAMHSSGDQAPLVANLHPHWHIARKRENGTNLITITGVPTIEMDYRRLR
jgi:hypothetical protein